MLFDKILNNLLTFQVKRTRSRSDKALGLRYYRFGTSALNTFFNGWTLYSITFTNNDNLFPFQLHLCLLLVFQKVSDYNLRPAQPYKHL